MSRVSSDMLYFFHSWLIPKISEEYKISDEKAMKDFVYSETYKMLFDYSTKLFRESPLVIFDMYKAEKEKGDPRESSYIKGDAYV
jgi:hypothetical protein